MRILILFMLFVASAFAKVVPPVASTSACGHGNVSFKVKLDEPPHALAQPEPGKARVYFFHDARTNATIGYSNGEARDRWSMGRRKPR
jgi:hypothetical protein